MVRAERTAVALAVTVCAAITAQSASAQVKIDDILRDTLTVGDVVTIGLGPHGQRYSPLTLANRETVKRLEPSWSIKLGPDVRPSPDNSSKTQSWPQGVRQCQTQSQPLVRDGVLYFSGTSHARAVDARTGQQIWRHDHRARDGVQSCNDIAHRGAALHGDRIFVTTPDARLVALDVKTGAVAWAQDIADQTPRQTEISAPMIVPSKAHGPLVVTGVARGEFGVVGRVEARRADSGALVWSRPTIEGHLGTLVGKPETMTGTPGGNWPDDMWTRRGGATWLGGTYDSDTRLIFFGTGAPAPKTAPPAATDEDPGDRKWSRARIAIDPETGTIKWGFQTTPNLGWDYDGVNEVIAFDMGGQKVVATADRNGFFYVLDRSNGKFVSAFPFVSKINWARGIDKSGRPIPEPALDARRMIVPSPLGGKNWMPMAYSRDTKLFYVPSNEWGQTVSGNGAIDNTAELSATKPVFETHVGSLKALDPATGQMVWEYRNPGPLWGGVLATAGGLVMFGTPEGELKALDAATGEPLWSRKTGGSIASSPITWSQDGEQMFAVVVSPAGTGPMAVAPTVGAKPDDADAGPTLLTFKLPKNFAATSN